ncbi:MAG: type II secretion system F family protein [Paucibacter sp.]|nr:type II secretion system F family protein [Roseateles sp.]
MEYRYRAADRNGRTFEGQLQADSERAAQQQLQQQDLTPISLNPVQRKAARGTGKAPTDQDLLLALRELATLLQAGVPLAEAVSSCASAHLGTQLGDGLDRAHSQLRSGSPLSEALRAARLRYPEYLYQLLQAGELTGKLADALFGAAEQMEYELRVRSDMRSALTYPAILVLSGIAATLLIFIVVVPRFSGILKNPRADIPAISRWVLEAGLFTKENLVWIGLSAFAFFAAIAIALGNPQVRRQLLDRASHLPLFGDWLVNSEVGRWAKMFGTLLANKVPIVQAMELSEMGVRLSGLANRLSLAQRDLRAGKKLAEALETHRTVNAMGLNLVRVGERSGELPLMLKTLGNIYETASRDRMKRFLTLLEPLTILIVGSLIGFIMVAIMLAITSISTGAF